MTAQAGEAGAELKVGANLSFTRNANSYPRTHVWHKLGGQREAPLFHHIMVNGVHSKLYKPYSPIYEALCTSRLHAWLLICVV